LKRLRALDEQQKLSKGTDNECERSKDGSMPAAPG
jgi:hypothetical protein